MPSTRELRECRSGSTPDTIYNCLNYLYNLWNQNSLTRSSQWRVSLIIGSGSNRLYIGDDLELANPLNNKLRKKRWWEDKEFNQLKLPFALFQPAEIVSMSKNRDGRFELGFKFIDDDGTTKYNAATFYIYDSLREGGHSIKAIRIHTVGGQETVEREPENPFVETGHRARGTPITPRDTIQILLDGLRRGLVVTTDRTVYNRDTGEQIGYEFEMRNEAISRPFPNSPIAMSQRQRYPRCSMRMQNGERYQFIPLNETIEFSDSDTYVPPYIPPRVGTHPYDTHNHVSSLLPSYHEAAEAQLRTTSVPQYAEAVCEPCDYDDNTL
ncbi:MAG: hypothetical protein ACYSUB_01695 [Planctomycetota bacterium]|jgi:hypothetical protein